MVRYNNICKVCVFFYCYYYLVYTVGIVRVMARSDPMIGLPYYFCQSTFKRDNKKLHE